MRFTKLFAAVLAASTIAGSAVAADLPSRKAPPVAYAPLPVMTWAGLYVGVNAGYTFGADRNVAFANYDVPGAGFAALAAAGAIPLSLSAKRDGFIGGGQIGYNWQFGSLVAGLEADFQGTTAKANTNYISPVGAYTLLNSKLDYLGTVRGRFGFAVAPSVLLYATGGLAYGNSKVSYVVGGPAGAFANTTSQTKAGYTVGAGVEWAFAPSWSVKGEYLYYDLGRQGTTLLAAVPGGFTTSTASVRNSGHIVRAGLNYKFNWGAAPVVARY